MNVSFSQHVKEELVGREFQNDSDARLWLCCALAASATFRSNEVYIKSAQQIFIEKLRSEAERLWQLDADFERKKTYSFLSFAGEEQAGLIRAEMEELLDYNTVRGTLQRAADNLDRNARQIALRAFFLAVGSFADPTRSYQIEFSLRRQSVARFLEDLLALEGIDVLLQQQGGYRMLYVKNGDQIADFLGATGAHRSLLHFEDTRVRKNLNEIVNRAVNCDNANLQRVADTAARQIELLRDLEQAGGLVRLPDTLREVAKLRLEHPGLSIRELGEYLDPPLGKSGMYHRLGKLETWARQYLNDLEA